MECSRASVVRTRAGHADSVAPAYGDDRATAAAVERTTPAAVDEETTAAAAAAAALTFSAVS